MEDCRLMANKIIDGKAIAAIGKTEFLKADMVKDGAVVIDVGINRGRRA